MPDALVSSWESGLQRSAIEAIDAWVCQLGPCRRLTPSEVKSYKKRNAVAGWRLSVTFTDKVRELDLLVDQQFPREQPRIALANPPPFLSFPHVEKDGILCILPETAGISVTDPIGVVANVLGRAVSLVEEIVSGQREEDFKEEFQSYWCSEVSRNCQEILSLLRAVGPTRSIRVWRGTDFHIVSESEADLIHWMKNRYPKNQGGFETELGLLLWLNQPLVPEQYPKTATDLRLLSEACNGGELLQHLMDGGSKQVVALLGATGPNGPCFGGVVIDPGRSSGFPKAIPRSKLYDGFRKGKLPSKLLESRLLSTSKVTRSIVERIDPPWIHGRGQDDRFERLQGSRTAILGCGSLGAPVASLLARAGLGHLVLVDPELLSFANTGRHVLGSRYVKRFKSDSLARQLREEFPHIHVDAWTCRWEEALEKQLETLSKCDLIISGTGSWAAEGALNEWHIRHQRSLPIIYGWTEPYALAGHAVAIISQGGCFQCGMSETGVPSFPVTRWLSETTAQEPACGAVFQPYGPVELQNVVTLVSELALDTLLGRISESTHRMWTAKRDLIIEAGGAPSAEWLGLVGDLCDPIAKVRKWERRETCNECQGPLNRSHIR